MTEGKSEIKERSSVCRNAATETQAPDRLIILLIRGLNFDPDGDGENAATSNIFGSKDAPTSGVIASPRLNVLGIEGQIPVLADGAICAFGNPARAWPTMPVAPAPAEQCLAGAA